MNVRKYTWEEFEDDCKKIVEFISDKEFRNIYGIPRGGLVLAVKLSHLLNDKLIILNAGLISSDTLVVDDISDSGKTLLEYYDCSKTKLYVTLWIKEGTLFTPSFYIRTKSPDEWVIFPWETEKEIDSATYGR